MTAFDFLGRNLAGDRELHATTYAYDVLGNQTKVTDPAGPGQVHLFEPVGADFHRAVLPDQYSGADRQ